ncbi:MAG: phosphatidate cytidylyltransferase [Gammaproteobacteria bacterium]|nr:phosphatidate cytidylyltransferase [Gammaproteobacteria bacterium]
MNWQRLATAAVAIPVIIAITLVAPYQFFYGLVLLFFLIGLWEWGGLCATSLKQQASYFAATLVMLALVIVALNQCAPYSFFKFILIPTVIWWLLLVPLFWLGIKKKNLLIDGGIGVIGLTVTAISLVFIYDLNPIAILVLFTLVWTNDSAAYYIGKTWGRHKMSPTISPNKTWEGLIGGVVMTALIAVVWILILQRLIEKFDYISSIDLVFLLIWSVPMAMAGVVGDLIVSLLKRHANKKDSGAIFPGHGGVLDRIDGLIAVAPIFALLLSGVTIGPMVQV